MVCVCACVSQDYAWKLFNNILTHCQLPNGGIVSLTDVRKKTRGTVSPAHLFGATFKYAYLLFSSPDALDLDRVVFNTEGHAFTVLSKIGADTDIFQCRKSLALGTGYAPL